MEKLKLISHFAELVRFSHTIFALPFALASLFLASKGIPSLRLLVLIILAVTLCRNSAMAFNRLVDAKIDAKNSRTEKRHLPSGILNRLQVIIFMIFNMISFVIITYFLNFYCFAFAIPTLGIVCVYSYFKRFSNLSPFFLGISLGISPIATWIAVDQSISLESILLGFSLLFWVAGFDTIYATADYDFDKSNKLHSAVTWLGIDGALLFAKVCHLCTFLFLCVLGIFFLPTTIYFICLILILLILLYIHFYNTNCSLDGMNQIFFLANALISILLLTGVVFSILWR